MFLVEVGAVLTTVLAIADPSAFAWWVVAWLWLTVIFANLAEAVAEGRPSAGSDAAGDQERNAGSAPGQRH
jgi:K+-transporting ATPase ATPase B chain